MHFYIDVFGHCNLKCPSCTVSNTPGSFVKGLMTEALLQQILKKATAECSVAGVSLYNWTEPLLHPHLPELVGIVNSFGLRCQISSNLNVLRDPDKLMAANPFWFRVSVSGFRQEIYELGHRHGHIERVKENMRLLAEAKTRQGAGTDLELFFHKYIDNEEDEAPMKTYAESLGYRFQTVWAALIPVEKALTHLNPDQPESVFTDEDRAVVDRLALPPLEALEVASHHNLTSCTLMDDFVTIDVRGDVYLCCGVSVRPSNRIGNFLDMPLDEIQARKRTHRLCGPCMKHGLVVYFNQTDPAFDGMAERARANRRARPEKIRSE